MRYAIVDAEGYYITWAVVYQSCTIVDDARTFAKEWNSTGEHRVQIIESDLQIGERAFMGGTIPYVRVWISI